MRDHSFVRTHSIFQRRLAPTEPRAVAWIPQDLGAGGSRKRVAVRPHALPSIAMCCGSWIGSPPKLGVDATGHEPRAEGCSFSSFVVAHRNLKTRLRFRPDPRTCAPSRHGECDPPAIERARSFSAAPSLRGRTTVESRPPGGGLPTHRARTQSTKRPIRTPGSLRSGVYSRARDPGPRGIGAHPIPLYGRHRSPELR